MESILTSVKKLLGITEEYEHFDPDIILHINTVFSILQQLGVGDPAGFLIYDKTSKWSDFIVSEDPRLNMVKSYMFLKVKEMFDPPQSGIVMEAMKRQIAELEWRLNVQVDPANSDNTGYDVVTATDEEVQDLIEDLDGLGPVNPNPDWRDPDPVSPEEIEYIKENLDDLDICETASEKEVDDVITGLDKIDETDKPGDTEDGTTASDADIEELISGLDNLNTHETATDEEVGDLIGGLDILGGNDTGDNSDDDGPDDPEATQEDIEGLIGDLDAL